MAGDVNLKEVALINAFATPIEWYEMQQADQLNARLRDDIVRLRETTPGLERSNRRGWHSAPDLFQRTEPCIREVCELIRYCVTRTNGRHFPGTKRTVQDFRFTGWINVNPQGAYNSPHKHGSELWSGTYYVHVPQSELPDSGAIEFLDPRAQSTFLKADVKSHFLQENLRFRPKAGRLVVFPSYILHWVTPNQEADERISIAFNARVKP